jgi:5-carboxymethyl-2-hydroxymuconate isomerase
MANVPTPEFQKFWSNQTDSLRMEYGDTIQQHPDTDAVIERVHGVLIATARLAECTPASVREGPKWTTIVQNMAETRRYLHLLLKGKQLYSALYGVYTEVLHNLMAVLKENTAKGETAKITATESPSNEEFHKQRRRKQKPPDDTIHYRNK